MKSLAFPNMFSSARTYTVADHEATASNLSLLLKSTRGGLFGDPYFGTILKKVLYEQNTGILQDLVIDEIYTAILAFMPQLKVERKNIKLQAVKDTLYASIQCVNLIDYQLDMYNIALITAEEI